MKISKSMASIASYMNIVKNKVFGVPIQEGNEIPFSGGINSTTLNNVTKREALEKKSEEALETFANLHPSICLNDTKVPVEKKGYGTYQIEVKYVRPELQVKTNEVKDKDAIIGWGDYECWENLLETAQFDSRGDKKALLIKQEEALRKLVMKYLRANYGHDSDWDKKADKTIIISISKNSKENKKIPLTSITRNIEIPSVQIYQPYLPKFDKYISIDEYAEKNKLTFDNKKELDNVAKIMSYIMKQYDDKLKIFLYREIKSEDNAVALGEKTNIKYVVPIVDEERINKNIIELKQKKPTAMRNIAIAGGVAAMLAAYCFGSCSHHAVAADKQVGKKQVQTQTYEAGKKQAKIKK